ncbi:uncharacterized protein EI90DRAFT_3118996 [Cantharellus anzutake]|uniref:uncharacterized protein n=1 Tax=Cantharellus anzutake TaxID=1750568 RepID=UPI001902CBE8|nr:uncharacterized protein EI90DRAFT_3118996 [Cantharellus anzutake]KAF8337549.1 hypothetical protein EI90DRAFT_3118996 [Cantharellus anzutake]
MEVRCVQVCTKLSVAGYIENVASVNIDIIALHITEKEPPPEVLDVAQHWRMISTVGNELRDRGADVGKVARRVVQLLDELEVNDDEDVIATWIQMLPS